MPAIKLRCIINSGSLVKAHEDQCTPNGKVDIVTVRRGVYIHTQGYGCIWLC